MPKLRRVRTPEEAKAVPEDKPVIVQLAEESTVEVPETPEVEVKKPEPPPAPEPELEAEEDNPLQRQIDDMRRAEELQRGELQRALAENARLQREQVTAQERQEQAQYVAVVNALGAAQEAADRAQADFETAMGNADHKAAAEAQRRLALQTARIDRLEDDKALYDARAEEAKKRPAPAPAPQDFESRIAQLPEVGKTWLRARPEYMTDPVKNGKIVAAHNYITEIEGKQAWTPDYFQALETHLGIRERQPAASPPPERRSPPVSAPPSRETPNLSTGRPQRREITLTPEQREAARIAGVDDFVYAKGIQELERRKKLGMYPDR